MNDDGYGVGCMLLLLTVVGVFMLGVSVGIIFS